MNNFWRTIIAGYGAKKLGGGCLSTIIIFIVIYYALGTCNSHPVQTRHAGVLHPAYKNASATVYDNNKLKFAAIFPISNRAVVNY
jgi:hypothetical protein